MTEKEQLWYLIDNLLGGKYQTKTFCEEFSKIYNLEINYDELSIQENQLFDELSSMTSRFSDNEEELKIPNMYYCCDDIISKVKEIVCLLSLKTCNTGADSRNNTDPNTFCNGKTDHSSEAYD